jgi:DNA replication licensing factor MCM7
MTVYVKGELTRQVKPGEMVTITGIFLPVPFTGYKAMKAGLLTQTFLEAMYIQKEKQTYEDALASPTDRAHATALFNSGGGQSVYDRVSTQLAAH